MTFITQRYVKFRAPLHEPQKLRFGEHVSLAVREQRGRWEDPKHYQEREVIEAFLNLPAQQRKVVREVVMALTIAVKTDAGKKSGDS